MNSFALSADSRNWWLPAAIAGAIGTAALGAILILPTNGQSVNNAPNAPAVSVPADDGAGRSCFSFPQRPPRNYGADELPQPAC